MKNILIFGMALIMMMAIDTIKNVLLAMYFFTVNPEEEINLSIFTGTAMGAIIFCFWSASRWNNRIDIPSALLTILVAIFFPLIMYPKGGDIAITLNQVSGEILGILFARLAHWLSENFVSE
jgi:hypothetical protein